MLFSSSPSTLPYIKNAKMNNIMTKEQALCLVFLKPFTPENVMEAKLALEESRLEICYRDDPQLPYLLPVNTYRRAISCQKIYAFPDEPRLQSV